MRLIPGGTTRSGYLLAAFFLLTVPTAMGTVWFIESPTAPAGNPGPSKLLDVGYRLRNLTRDRDGRVIGSSGTDLYRVQDGGDAIDKITRLQDTIQGLHVMASGHIVVSTDRSPSDPATPCLIHLVDPASGSQRVIKRLASATALWWSITSDASGAIYIGEYGPTDAGASRNVWKSTDRGETWEVVFRAPHRDGVHIHRVTVDPYTQDVWVTVGDGRENRGAYRSRDAGTTFKRVLDSQATGVAFTGDAIFWGEDHRKHGRITRIDRRSGKIEEVLRADRSGPYGGSIYDMTVADDGTVYAPTMKYPLQGHTATLWRGRDDRWELLAEFPVGIRGAVNNETIAGPDRSGWLYVTGYKIRHESR